MRITFSDAFGPVDHLSSIPLFLQIVFQVDEALRSGKLTQGALLPSENDLCEGFNVARSTLRRAMAQLAEHGTVSRERGRSGGTRIIRAEPVTRTPGTFATLFDQIAASARLPVTKLLVFQELVVDEALAAMTQLPVGAPVTHILRHRSANDEPIAVLENWILSDYLRFQPERLKAESMEALLREGGVEIHHADFEFRATLACETAGFFGIDADTPVVQEVRHVFDATRQYEYSEHYSHPENERLRGVAQP